MLRTTRAVVIFIAALMAVFSGSLFAQGTDLGTIRGLVTDASGAVVPNATVVVTDVATGIARTLTTNSDGAYETSGLKSGQYTINVSAPGFSKLQISNLNLRPGDAARADARLEVSRSAETVVVEAEAPSIQTENPTIGSTLTNEVILDVPRDSRDVYSFLYLNPNITRGASEGAFKFIGAQSYGASFSVDGQRSNGGVFGEPTASQPSLETIGELTVLSNSFSAEYAGIANVRVTTRRGGQDYHGSLFYNNKNSALAAWDLRDKVALANFVPTAARSEYTKPYYNLNEFGASFGGPAPMTKKTYFFAGYERRLENSPVVFRSVTMPHPSMWAGDFSRLNDSIKPAVPAGVSLTQDEIAQYTVGGLGQRFIRLPQRLMSPYTTALIKNYFPQDASAAGPINPANGRMVDYYTNTPGRLRRHLGNIRVDHDFSDNDRLYVVYNTQNNVQANAAVVSPFTGLGLTQNERQNHMVSVSETHLFGPSLINEVRGGFNMQPNFRRSNNTLREFLQTIGFSEADIAAYGSVTTPEALDSYGHPALEFGTGYQNFTNGGRNTYRPLDQYLLTFGDTLTWVKGRHTIRAGADFVRNSALDGFTAGRGNPRGLITYTGTGPDTFARFLMGLPANRVRYVNQFRPAMDVYNWEQGFFVQDDFKVHPRLTLNMGLRYDVISPFTENNDLLLNFDPDFVGADGRKGRFVAPSERTIPFLDPRFLSYGVVTAEQAGVPRSLVKADRNNLAPRLGAAWRLTDRSVLRGGWGIFYPTSAAQGIRDPLATNSFQVTLSKRPGEGAPLQAWPNVMNGGVLDVLGGRIGANWVPFNLQQPRIQQYNVTFEQELGWETAIRLSYLGTRMSGLITGIDYNMIPANDQPFGTTTGDGVTPCVPADFTCQFSSADLARLPYPELSDFLIGFGNTGRGRSNAFQVEANRRMRGGFLFNASYTLLDQKSSAPDVGASSLGGTNYNQFDPNGDYGEDGYVSRHRFVSYGVFDTPFGRGRKFGSSMPSWLDAAIGKWELSWQMFAKSGTAFTPMWLCDNCSPLYPGNTASGNLNAANDFNGGMRPTVTGDYNVRSGDRIWNPDAFGLPPIGSGFFSNGVAQRNLLRGPGTFGLNAGVRKVFTFGESVRAELGADVNNILNHPLLSPDSSNTSFYTLGNFSMKVNPTTLQPEYDQITPNPEFGRLINSYAQENIDSRRAIRLRLRIQF